MENDECSELMHNLIFEVPIKCKELLKMAAVFENTDEKKLRVLFILNSLELMSMTDYSRKLGLTKSNFTFIANELVEEGYVSRKFDESDRRLIYLEITEKGRLYVEEQMKIYGNHLRNLFKSKLSEEDIRELNTYIKKSIFIFSKLIKVNAD